MNEAAQLYQEALQDFRNNKLEDAQSKLRHVLETSPAFEDAYEALSVILYTLKKYDEAITLLKQWIVKNPNSIMAHTNLSRCYVAKDMILEAEHEQAEARKLTWKADLKEKKQDVPAVDYKEKIARYKSIIELDPADVLGYFTLGTTYQEAGLKREAVDTFEKAIEVNPKHSSSYLGLGLALEALGDMPKAKKIFERGTRVAQEAGDIMPLKKMEAHLRALENHIKGS